MFAFPLFTPPMARFKAKAFVDDKEVDVELDDAQYLAHEQHDLRLSHAVEARLNAQARELRGQLLKDDGFVADVLKAKGIDPKAPKPEKGASAEDVERMQRELREKEVTPLAEKLTAAEQRAVRLIAARGKAELTKALVDAGVRKTSAARLAEMHFGEFAYDEKTDGFAQKQGDEYVFSAKATKDRPYKGFDEYAAEFVADKENVDFVERRTQGGPNLGHAPGSRGGVVTITKADAQFSSKWQAAEAEAAKIGGTVQVVDA